MLRPLGRCEIYMRAIAIDLSRAKDKAWFVVVPQVYA
jgi:hypothetical protein